MKRKGPWQCGNMETTGGLVWILIILVIVVFAVWRNYNTQPANRYRNDRKQECYRTIEALAELLGYSARKLVNRTEIGELVEKGSSPADIFQHVYRQVDQAPGLVLGVHDLGENALPIPVKLLPQYRDKHLYCIGKTGTGKSTFFARLLLQDIRAGHGVVTLVPEPEFYREKVLPRIPAERKDEVIFVDPADTDRPVAYNPVELQPGEDIDLRTDGLVQVFREALDATGPRMVPLLQHSFHALLEQKDTTLFDMYRLLSARETVFRMHVAESSGNPQVRRFFREEFPRFPKTAALPITNRLDRLLSSKALRTFLCQPHSGFSFRRAMDSGYLLMFNLSDGLLGEGNSHIIGQLLVAQFQQALLSRADMQSAERIPVCTYIDEFQQYAAGGAQSYERLLARARKYGARLHLAHQQSKQIEERMLREILGNVGTLVSFQLGHRDAKRMAPEFINQDLYGRTDTPDPKQFMTLHVGRTYCRIGQNAFYMRTEPDSMPASAETREEVLAASRRNFGVTPQTEKQHRNTEQATAKQEGTEPAHYRHSKEEKPSKE